MGFASFVILIAILLQAESGHRGRVLLFGTPIAGLVVTSTYLSMRANARRAQEFERFAIENGFRYERWSLDFFSRYGRGLKSLDQRAQRAFNVMIKQLDDATLAVFEHEFTTGTDEERSSIRRTVGYFARPAGNLPKMTLEPENLGHRLFEIFIGKDIDFPEYPEFSRKYHVQGEDENAIRRLFDREFVDFAMEQGDLCMECNADALVFWKGTRCVPLKELPAFLEDFKGLTQRLMN